MSWVNNRSLRTSLLKWASDVLYQNDNLLLQNGNKMTNKRLY